MRVGRPLKLPHLWEPKRTRMLAWIWIRYALSYYTYKVILTLTCIVMRLHASRDCIARLRRARMWGVKRLVSSLNLSLVSAIFVPRPIRFRSLFSRRWPTSGLDHFRHTHTSPPSHARPPSCNITSAQFFTPSLPRPMWFTKWYSVSDQSPSLSSLFVFPLFIIRRRRRPLCLVTLVPLSKLLQFRDGEVL